LFVLRGPSVFFELGVVGSKGGSGLLIGRVIAGDPRLERGLSRFLGPLLGGDHSRKVDIHAVRPPVMPPGSGIGPSSVTWIGSGKATAWLGYGPCGRRSVR